MGDSLPDDAYSYHWEDPVGSMESRYWSFVLDNYISCANEIYNHCLTSQNIHHTREMVALTQNYTYDFVNLLEFISLRRVGINVPFPRRSSYNVFCGNEDEIQVPPPPPPLPRRFWKNFRAEELIRKKKRGKNVRAAPFFPAGRNDVPFTEETFKDEDVFNVAEFQQPIQVQQQRPQRTVQEQTWAQVIPQVPQLTVPHYHVPYTNLVHYPIGNFVTHQISQSYPASCPSSINSHSLITTDVKSDGTGEGKNVCENVVSESAKSLPLVTDSAVQVEMTEAEELPSEINQSDSLSELEGVVVADPSSVDIIDEQPLNEEISTPANIEITVEAQSLPSLLNVEPPTIESMSSSSLEDSQIDNTIFPSIDIQDNYSVFPSKEIEETIPTKSSYKEVLIKGLSSVIQQVPEKIDKEFEKPASIQGRGRWHKVNKKKANYDIHSNRSVSNTFHPPNRSLSPILEEDSENRPVSGKKATFSKTLRRRQNSEDLYAQTLSNKVPISRSQKIHTPSEHPPSTEWRDVVLKGVRRTKSDKKNLACDKLPIKSDYTFKYVEYTNEKCEDNVTEKLHLNVKSQEEEILKIDTTSDEQDGTCSVNFVPSCIKNQHYKAKKLSKKKRYKSDDFNRNLPDSPINMAISIACTESQDQEVSDKESTSVTTFPLIENVKHHQPIVYDVSASEFEHSLPNDLDSEILINQARIDELDFNINNAEALKLGITLETCSALEMLTKIDSESLNHLSSHKGSTSKVEYIVPDDIFDIHDEYDAIFSHLECACDIGTSLEEYEKISKTNVPTTDNLEFEDSYKLRQIRETEAKQQQAHEKRLQLLQCKTARVREQVQKVEEAKAAQYKLALQRKSQIDLKLKKAEENRNMYLSIIRKKAHDEEEKLKEIAFINELEAQNRRHDSLALRQEHEERLQTLIEERQRKVEEKAAKEAAVEERRRVLEAERQEKLKQMKEKRRRKEEIIDRKQQEKEKERLVIAREKAREREERLQARQAAQLATLEELQKRIQQKQEESARRHEENIELIRQKALEIGLHRNILDDVTNHMCYKFDENEVPGNIPQDKMKAHLKKRCKKVRSRLIHRGEEFVRQCNFLDASTSSFGKVPFIKLMIDLSRFCVDDLTLVEKNTTTIERILTEINNILENQVDDTSTQLFVFFKGFLMFGSMFEAFNCLPYSKVSPFKKMFAKMCLVYNTVLQGNQNGIKFSICSNNIMKVLDTLNHCIIMMKSNIKCYTVLTENILCTCEIAMKRIVSFISEMNPVRAYYRNMINDILSYTLTCGLTGKITEVFQLAVMNEGGTLIDLIPKFVQFLSGLLHPIFKSEELIRTLKATDCLGTVPLLYEGLQKMNPSSSLPLYAKPVIELLLSFAKLDISAFQETLGAEGMGLQMRAIASLLMSYCCTNAGHDDMLIAVIETVGYFAVHNRNNQSLIQSGQQPTILQQLVSLPFKFFCDLEYKAKLFPTLVVCSHSNSTNRAIVENECSYKELESFLEIPDIDKTIPLLKIFFDKNQTEDSPEQTTE